jgi:DNA-binding MarR family transcriptional regulator
LPDTATMRDPHSKPALPRNFQAKIPELLEGAGYSASASQALLDLDSAIFQWKSAMMKGDVPARMIAELGVDLDLTQFRFLTAITRIQDGVGRDAPVAATIGLVAEELNVDPSRASRLASDLIKRGYLRRKAAQEDGRKSIVVLTDHAEEVFTRFRALKWTKFLSILADWEVTEIAEFARLFEKYFASADSELRPGPD